jgi:hypothetical protein
MKIFDEVGHLADHRLLKRHATFPTDIRTVYADFEVYSPEISHFHVSTSPSDVSAGLSEIA